MKSRTPVTVEVIRGNAVESSHQVIVAVSDERGLISDFWGNVDYLTFPRSGIKPLQALAFVESGAMEKFSLDDRMLALACSSHAGEKHQVVILQEWLAKLKLTESDFACGPAFPAHEASHHEMIKKGQSPSAIFNNCSGKHLGILSSCLILNESIKDYHKIEHPAQARIRKILSELMKNKMEKLPVGVDGCGIPTHATPLGQIASGFSAFFNQKEISTARKASLQRILNAWRNNPSLIGNTQDFAFHLGEATKGRALLKTGAEGVYCGVMPEKGISFALKTVDGAKRAAEAVSALVFKRFGGMSEAEFQELKSWTTPALKNTRGEVTGLIKVTGIN